MDDFSADLFGVSVLTIAVNKIGKILEVQLILLEY